MRNFQLLKILTPKESQKMLMIMILIIIGMFFEMLGLGLVIPAISLMIQPDFYKNHPQFLSILHVLGNPSQSQLVIVGMLGLAAVYIVKCSYIVWMQWRQNTFIYSLQAELSSRLFRIYLSQPWKFHLRYNSAELVCNIIQEVSVFVGNVMQPAMVLLTESFVLIGILGLLFYLEPMGGLLITLVFGSAAFGFQYYVRNRIVRWGNERQISEKSRIHHLHQGLGGIKDIKYLGRESYFLQLFQHDSFAYAEIGKKQKTLTDTPRLWLELLSVLGLAILVITRIFQGAALESLIPIVGVFAAAAFRVIPSVNRCVVSLQSLRFGVPVIEKLFTEFTTLQDLSVTQEQSILPSYTVLSLKNIHYSYPLSDSSVLTGISMQIPFGKTVGFIGGSGAGKSTLVDIILGLLTPCQGAVMVDGIDIQSNLRAWQNKIGYVPQSIYLTDDTLYKNIAFGIEDSAIDKDAVLRAVRSAQLDSFVHSLPEGIHTIVGERGVRLSGGQRQRIGIARALYHNPSVLVLDEATSALDYQTEKDVMEAIQALHGQKTIIIVAHRLSTVAQCDIIYRLENGQVVDSGSFEAVVGQAAQES